MKDPSEFYIGWKENMPAHNRNFLKKILVPLFILIPLLVLGIVLFEKPFNDHQFEFGKSTTITGTYYHSPVPILIADKGELSSELSPSIVLVGYGKFGARGFMEEIEKNAGILDGKKISLAGTLIYGDGKTLMELTSGEEALVEVIDQRIQSKIAADTTGLITLRGEIIDPKCYFGVMKPGEGKVHKSCAIRCISGGIPPVFKVRTSHADTPFHYYLLLGRSGNEINDQVLPYVAEQIELTGTTTQFLDWDVLYIDELNNSLLIKD